MARRKESLWKDMDETSYRESQICRVIGNPKTYQIMMELERLGEATPTQLATLVHRSVSTVCCHLRSLRESQLVRFLKNEAETVYRIKPAAFKGLRKQLRTLVLELRRLEQ